MKDAFGKYAIVSRDGQRLFTMYETLSSAAANDPVAKFLGRCKAAPVDNSDAEYIKALGAMVVKKARRSLPEGAFNNRMKGGPHRKIVCDTGSFGFITGKVPRSMILTGEDLGVFLDEKWSTGLRLDELGQQYVAMAGRCWGTAVVGGGVCSMISHMALGLLTHLGYDLFASIVYADVDHSFVIIGRPSTCWYVVDPWVNAPYVLPLAHCCFAPGSLKYAWPLRITNAAEAEFGICPSDLLLEQTTVRKATSYREASAYDRQHNPLPDHPWEHYSNYADAHAGTYAGTAPVVGPLDWGAAVAE